MCGKRVQRQQRKRQFVQKSDLSTFDGFYFQTKPLRKLEILQKLLLLEFFFT